MDLREAQYTKEMSKRFFIAFGIAIAAVAVAILFYKQDHKTEDPEEDLQEANVVDPEERNAKDEDNVTTIDGNE